MLFVVNPHGAGIGHSVTDVNQRHDLGAHDGVLVSSQELVMKKLAIAVAAFAALAGASFVATQAMAHPPVCTTCW